ncbi:MAG: hypothetical protein CL678_16615 [Bdellovibrionaceae bacterium]|nr:hypothetical protein [Pseudobdellovibrionaceae bacterium]|tara:strand:+ start:1964 stop:3142 length:1179 start_codon:yes stop_codon:yes gene_type:complete
MRERKVKRMYKKLKKINFGISVVLISLTINAIAKDSMLPTQEGVGTGGGGGNAEDVLVRKIDKQLGTRLEITGEAQNSVKIQKPKKGAQVLKNEDLSKESTKTQKESNRSPLFSFELRSGLVGPREDLLQDLSAWCSRVERVLSRAKRDALLISRKHRLGQGNGRQLVLASRRLEVTLERIYHSLNIDPEIGGPLTWTLVKRGLELNAILKADSNQSTRAKKARYDFLDQYVRFIIRMERNVDSRYYLAYWYHWYPRCRTQCHDEWADYRNFEALYVDYVREHLDFLSRKFLLKTYAPHAHGGTRVVPIGDSNYVTKLAERVTTYAAQDLMETLYVYRDASLIWDLIDISEDLRDGYYVGPGRFDHLKSDLDCIVDYLDRSQFRNSCRSYYQ